MPYLGYPSDIRTGFRVLPGSTRAPVATPKHFF